MKTNQQKPGRPPGIHTPLKRPEERRQIISVRLPRDMVAWLRKHGLTATIEKAVKRMKEGK